nr:hypothetical protein [Bradyrhizobium genosp. SA-3]
MRYVVVTAIGVLTTLTTTLGPAVADPWKDESGKGRWGYEDRGPFRAYGYDREYKQENYRGPCKIERKWGKHGRVQGRDQV